MYTLFGRKGAGSVVVEAMLAEAGALYRVEDVERDADGSLSSSLRRYNPRAEVPTLILPDDSVMTESAAIAIYLADIHPEAKLAPAVSSPARARYLRWLVYFATTIYMSDLRMYYPERYSADASAALGIKARAIEHIGEEFAVFAEALGKGPYILGSVFSVADIYAAMLYTWAPDANALFATHPNLKAHYERVVARPAVAQVWARNEM